MKNKALYLILVFFLLPVLAFADDKRFGSDTYTLAQTTLSYRYAEICHNGTKPLLVLYLHGGSSRGSDNESQLNEVAVGVIYKYLHDRNIPATLIVPQCPLGGGWTSQLRRVVNELLRSYVSNGKADVNRIYVVGGPMGGTGTWCQLGNYPDFYAAAMPVAGNPTSMNAEDVAKTPVYTVMGTADNIMSLETVETFCEEVLANGGTLLMDVEEGWTHQDTCEKSYTDARLDWLFSNIRGISAGILQTPGMKSPDIESYNLNGIRVSRNYHGIVVQNGKKSLVK